MNRHIFVSLLKTLVLPDILHVITTYYNGSIHLHLTNGSSEDTTANGDVAGKGTFLVDVGTEDSLFGSFIAQANRFVVT